MREDQLSNGGIVITDGDGSDGGDQLTAMPVIRSFNPVKGAAHCACGAPLLPWALRSTAGGIAELSCHRCNQTIGTFELVTRTSR